MDPVSALGVAAAALQFLDASSDGDGLLLTREIAVKAYTAFQEIRSSAESSTERNKQLEDNIRAAKNLRSSLISASTSQRTADPVTELTTRCASKSDELLTLLEYVRGSGKDISSIRATFRAVKKGKHIEKLHSSLTEDRVALDQMISQKLLSSIDLLTVVQSNEFAHLSSSVQKLIGDLVEQRIAQQANHDILAGKLDSVRSDMQLRFSDADRTMMREKVLESLFFPEIYQRRSEIKEPAPNTLGWLFAPESEASSTSSVESERYNESDSDSEQGSENDSAWESDTESNDECRSQPLWSNFRQWLREDTSMYWISGKAGSGKSTLMSHIVNDQRTLHDLNIWREGHELKVLSFFFWRAGTRLQNSVLGLLRSLLYQLCLLQPLIADNILARLSTPVGMIPIWTERSLLDHITMAVQTSIGFRFCVFIDGLDEFTGPYDDLIDHINLLQGFGNLKVCASSRPELELANKLRGLKQLRLQDLNWGDIKHFVQGSLTKTQLDQKERIDLAKQIVGRAEGVFLWASLVTQSLLKGIMAGDDQDIIQTRLNSLPADMEQLFERMLKGVDVVYHKSLALYVQLKIIEREFNLDPFTISIIATLQLQKRISSYEQFVNQCEKTELWITTRSAGLLEVYDYPKDPQKERKEDWKRCKTKFINNKPHFMLVADSLLDRCRCAKDEAYPAMLEYEKRSTRWIHRSAFEFFSNLSEKIPSFKPVLSREALFRKISASYISYLSAAPSCMVDELLTDETLMVLRLRTCLRFVSKWYNEYPTTASVLLDNMFSLYTRLEKDELWGAETQEWFDPDTDDFTAEIAFWSECVATENWPYISSRIGCISKRTAGSLVVAHLMAMSMDYMQERFDSLAETLLRLTLQRLEVGGVGQTPTYKCIASAAHYDSYSTAPLLGGCFICASWREVVLDTPVSIMSRLIHIISRPLFYRESPRFDINFSLFSKKLPEPFLTLIEITHLYVAPNLKLKRMSVQISAHAWARFRYSLLEREYDRSNDRIEKLISAIQVPRGVKLLCVPSFKKRPSPITHFFTGWEQVVELKDSQFVSFHPSTATSSQLLSLFKCFLSTPDPEFHMTPDSYKKREEVCDLLLQEIKSAKLGLDGSQQLVAAACIQAGLLDPDIEETSKRYL
ncbi:hypothetical protein FHL15_009386 [Xylaria flabelliformis]|uniref:Nephrocystin 3-like N-terminal domain-containing protein n=1 Tax=Xylaria flabelliformis TaxID=2512241 RepID=A0A553HPB9_9PEZI|nr:hypothetical protein FHL15_009386 [Xylaria flabelliformis]